MRREQRSRHDAAEEFRAERSAIVGYALDDVVFGRVSVCEIRVAKAGLVEMTKGRKAGEMGFGA